MAVVVNEFEVLPSVPVVPTAKEREREEETSRDTLAPATVDVVLRALEVHMLRSWAH